LARGEKLLEKTGKAISTQLCRKKEMEKRKKKKSTTKKSSKIVKFVKMASLKSSKI
jgi:hypothetical protein